MSNFTVRQVEVPAGSIEIHELGDGAPLLFVHGALVGWELWEPVAAPLAAAGYRVIIPTLPMGAHRKAMQPDTDLRPPGLAQLIVDLIAALDLTAPTVVSNDTCTAITQLVLTLHPGVIGRAVLTSGDAFRYFFPPLFKPVQSLGYLPGALKVLAKAVRRPALRNSPVAFGLLTKTGISDSSAESWSAAMLTDKVVRRDAAKVLRGINSRYTMAAARALPSINTPVLLVWGEHDRAFPIRLATKLATLIPDSRVVTVPGAAAFVSLDAPEALVDAIVSFVPTRVG